MPISVKLFFAICLLLAAAQIYFAVHYLLVTAPNIVAHNAQLAAKYHGAAKALFIGPPMQSFMRAQRIMVLTTTGFWIAATLGLGYAAALRRQNWARWVLSIAIVTFFLLPFAGAGIDYLLSPPTVRGIIAHSAGQMLSGYRDPAAALVAIAKIAMLILIFSPNARPWFAKRASG